MTSTGLLHENITTDERINFQKTEIIVLYFLCNPSVTKQRNASDTTQKMPHWQDENIQRFALLYHIVSSTVCKHTAASASKHVRKVLAVLAKPLAKWYQAAWLLNMPQMPLTAAPIRASWLAPWSKHLSTTAFTKTSTSWLRRLNCCDQFKNVGHRIAGTLRAHAGQCHSWREATRACWCNCTPAHDATGNKRKHNSSLQ